MSGGAGGGAGLCAGEEVSADPFVWLPAPRASFCLASLTSQLGQGRAGVGRAARTPFHPASTVQNWPPIVLQEEAEVEGRLLPRLLHPLQSERDCGM